jgi:putative Mg2+ transporter-C (MgtC) family protein
MIPDAQILLRLIIAAGLGAVVGFERERQNQVAGLRTHIIVAVGSSLAMMLSIYIAISYHSQTGSADPARLAAQVISGIGFLGAGAILRFGTNVKGLTTAASLWTIAVTGLAVGAGMLIPAVGTTLLLLFALTLVNVLEKRLVRAYTTWTVTFQAIDQPELYEQFRQTLARLDQKVKSMGFTKDVGENLLTIEATIQAVENQNVEELSEQLAGLPGARHVRIHA